MNKKELNNLVTDVANRRADVRRAKETETALNILVTESPEWINYAAASKDRKDAEKRKKTAEAQLRVGLASAYDGEEKHPAAHRYLKSKILEYDVKAAVNHCAEHLRGALNLNKKKFETVAKLTVDDLDFVTMTEAWTVTLKSDLTALETDSNKQVLAQALPE